jgi:uncharacterized membrane protein
MTTTPRWLRRQLGADDLAAITQAIAAAEATTSAEIRVHLEPRVPRARLGRSLTPIDRAREVFASLGMHRTRERNGVLVYVALEDRKLAIVGDEGIHTRVGEAYWAEVRDLMVERFRQGAPREALVQAVREVGTTLARHFPRRPGDVDELPNTISLE